jgi:intracellular sulfur oxidation DsrE/DsrF family protein
MRTLLVLLAASLATPALAAKPTPPPAVQPAPKGKLLLAVKTGPEDMSAVSSAIRHAKVALESGYISEVELVFYGRAGGLFDPDAKIYPDDIIAALAEVRAMGVKVYVCGHTLQRIGVDPARVDRGEVVPAAIIEIARAVAAGFEVLNY